MDVPADDQLATEPTSVRNRTKATVHWKSGLAVLAAGATAVLMLDRTSPDDTTRMITVYYAVAIWLVAVMIWWLMFSGIPRLVRFPAAGLVLLVVAGGWFGLVRRLDFNGAMVPKLEWRWQPSAESARTRWQAAQSSHAVADDELDEPFRVQPADWPRYCGPDGSRVVREPLLSRDWSRQPPRELWKHPVGAAWSSFAVVGPRIYTQEQRGPAECVVCYHAQTGRELWVQESSARYETAMGGIGPRATPTVTEQGLYALGATGLLSCLDPVNGNQIWQIDVKTLANAEPPPWGFSASPLVHKDTVIVVVGGQAGSIAVSRQTGRLQWESRPHVCGYASPRMETISQSTTVLAFYGDGLSALDPDHGTELWHYAFSNMYQVNAAQPVRSGDLLLIGTGYDGGCVAIDPLRLTEGSPAEAWPPTRHLKLKFNEAVERDGFVYGLDDGILCCIEVATGRRRWKAGRYRHGQLLLWGDVLLVQTEKGRVALVAASPDEFKEISQFQGLSASADGPAVKAWNMPVVCRSRLYMRTDRVAACYELPPGFAR